MILKDKRLGNYEVHLDGDNYTVVENYTNKKGKESSKIHGYYSFMDRALVKISNKLVDEGEEYNLEGYLEALKKTTTSMKQVIIDIMPSHNMFAGKLAEKELLGK